MEYTRARTLMYYVLICKNDCGTEGKKERKKRGTKGVYFSSPFSSF
jgi:hypothetical protein